MMNTIESVSLNYETDLFYITIKNNKQLLDRVFSGMFVIARRVLGYSGNTSSYPFSSSAIYNGLNTAQSRSERLIELGQLPLPTTYYPHKNNKSELGKHSTYFINMENNNATSHDSFFKQTLREQGEHFDKSAVNTSALMRALFADHFDDMVEYARNNRTWSGW